MCAPVLVHMFHEPSGRRAPRIRTKAAGSTLRRAEARLGAAAVFDGWSEGVVLAELPAAYAALAAGGRPDLPPLAASYVDYSFWQRGRLEDERGALAPQLAYWRGQLAGAPAGAPLRGDFRGPPGPGSMGGSLPLVLPADLVRSLRSLTAACGATLFVVVLTAWKARPSRSCMRTPRSARGRLPRGPLCASPGVQRRSRAALRSLHVPPLCSAGCRRGAPSLRVLASPDSRVGQPQQHLCLTAPTACVLRRLLPCMQVLLGQHSGSDDIITCTPMAGRTAPELEPLVGAQHVVALPLAWRRRSFFLANARLQRKLTSP